MGDLLTQEPPGKLEQLAEARFRGTLTLSERKLMRAAPNAPPRNSIAQCGPNLNEKDPQNDPSKADKEWGPEREIRAEVIRWLCVEEEAKREVDPKGIWVYGAKITGKLDLSYVIVPFPIKLVHCRLMGDGKLYGAQLPLLSLQGSWVRAISADRLDVKGSVYLRNGFHAEGEVRLLGAQVGGDFDCGRGTFINPSGDAMSADRINVQGGVFLSTGFRAEGVVRLPSAEIGADLECTDGTLTKLDARSATVRGDFWWWGLKDAAGTEMNLENASVGSIGDDDDEKHWPKRLVLDGFVYGRISKGPTDAESRLRWLARQDPFTPQPYRQLAKVLRETGDDQGARRVLHEMERVRRQQRAPGPFVRIWGWLLRWTIGYGYYPLRAFVWLLGLAILGTFLFNYGSRAGVLVPTGKEAYQTYRCERKPPANYEDFSPFIYSVENSLPFVKLGNADKWQPDPHPEVVVPCKQKPAIGFGHQWAWTVVLRWFRRFQISAGWLLATLFLAGVSGIIRKD
jgi:hypothetical protein